LYFEEWNETIIVPIYKKGDRERYENYGEIALGNAAYKILVKFKTYVENITGDY
jgi:hypothetical protein